jgi:hypothetical protein
MTTTTTTPLRPDAVESIVAAHEARRRHLMHDVGELVDAMPSMTVAYRPTGAAVGVVVATDGGVVPGAALAAAKGAGTPLGAGTTRQVILVEDRRELRADDLADIRVDTFGKIIGDVRPPARRAPAGSPSGDDHRPVDPAWKPLDDFVASKIISLHRDRVPRWIADPLGSLKPEIVTRMPVIPWGYAATNGDAVGSPIDPDVAEHADRLVVLNDNFLPTAAWLISHVQVHTTGRVTMGET